MNLLHANRSSNTDRACSWHSTVAEHLCEMPHIQLLTSTMEKHLRRVDLCMIEGEMVGPQKK